MAGKAEAKNPVEELFEVELDGIVRDVDDCFGAESYEVTFDCRREGQRVEVSVRLNAETVATLEIVPMAMSEMHRVFAALAEQTLAWTIEEK